MKTNGSVETEVVHWLEASDLHQLVKQANLIPKKFGEFYSVKAEEWKGGLKITLKESLNVAPPIELK